ncbi:MAG TPA: ABC transporter permease [Vicinamibacterales bacterium]
MIIHNLKLAGRTLVKTPFVTFVAIVSLALGIGANAAIFSLFDQMLLRSLPVPDPGRLVNLAAPGPKPGGQSCSQAGDCEEVFSYPMFRDLERVQTVFTSIAAHRTFGANLSYRGQTLSGEGMYVSGSYFPVLGVQPALGRLLTPDDERAQGQSPVAVLNYGWWQSRLGGNPNVLDDTLIVNGQSLTIVGVAPRGFTGTTLGATPQVFVPMTMRMLIEPNNFRLDNRRSYWAYLFARLRPGVSMDQASVMINVPYRQILADVEAPLQKGMSDQTMARFKTKSVVLENGWRGQSSVHGEARTPLLILFSVTGLVLLIACANIANLLLARAASRATEMAVRLSLGATRRQLVAQLLVESCLLALCGGFAGMLVARWTLDLILSLLPEDIATTLPIAISTPVFFFAAALSIGTGVLFGLFPALHSTRPDLLPTLKGQAGQPAGNRAAQRFRTTLATAQIAISMTLLASAGMFTKSLVNISRVDLGANIDSVVTFGVSPQLNAYTSERTRALYTRLEEELAAMPGATGVSAALVPILAGSSWGTDLQVEGFKTGPDVDSNSRFNEVSAGYFKMLGVPLLSGREFTRADILGAPKVAIVNEAFAKKFNLGRDAVGKRMGYSGAKQPMDVQIVGLVQNAKYSDVKGEVPPLFFRPYLQNERPGSMTYYVRTANDPAGALAALPRIVASLDANLPVENLRTMSQQVRNNVFMDRMITTLSAAFATLATLLAAVGLYGVLAYTVTQRTREIGLRMALGAAPGRVRAMMLRQVGLMTIVGAAIGLTAAVWASRGARSLLYQLQGSDPAVLMGSTLVLALVALAAGTIPAHRASRIDPMRALRWE